MKINPDKKAFPRPGSEWGEEQNGMTYREWLIGQTLGKIANGAPPSAVAHYTIQCVDALFKLVNEGATPYDPQQ